MQFDPVLGWVPKPGLRFQKENWGGFVTINQDSTRNNGLRPRPLPRPYILTVGDSFTFGSDNPDEEAWPAILERKLAVKVINGGVFFYGLDQIVLRAKQLIKRYKPNIIIVSLIADDISRMGASIQSGYSKPYYTHENGKLIFHQPKYIPMQRNQPTFRRLTHLFRYSYLLNDLMIQFYPQDWLVGRTERVNNDPPKLACLLLTELDVELAKMGIRAYLLPLYGGSFTYKNDIEPIQKLRACLAKTKYIYIDVLPDFAPAQENKAADHDLYGQTRHFSIKGNRVVAERVVQILSATESLTEK